jgi:quercetin dioxygenase-like cupin family protein
LGLLTRSPGSPGQSGGEAQESCERFLPPVMATVWRGSELEWRPAGPGVVSAALHRHANGGGAALFRLEAGATIPEHGHVAGEHVYVITGRLRFGQLSLAGGDALWVEPGEHHDVEALTEAVFLAVSPPKRRG